jgi:hypothetical protein
VLKQLARQEHDYGALKGNPEGRFVCTVQRAELCSPYEETHTDSQVLLSRSMDPFNEISQFGTFPFYRRRWMFEASVDHRLTMTCCFCFRQAFKHNDDDP